MKKPTKAQQRALLELYRRYQHKLSGERAIRPNTYLRFRRNAFWAFGDCLMVPWAGMIVGIEADGHTHS